MWPPVRNSAKHTTLHYIKILLSLLQFFLLFYYQRLHYLQVPPYAEGIRHFNYKLCNLCNLQCLAKCLVHFHCSRQLMHLLLSFSDAVSSSEILSFQLLSLVCDLQTARLHTNSGRGSENVSMTVWVSECVCLVIYVTFSKIIDGRNVVNLQDHTISLTMAPFDMPHMICCYWKVS